MGARQGITLDRYLRSKGPLPPAQVARIGCRVVQKITKELSPSTNGRPPVICPARLLVVDGGSVEVLPAKEADPSQSVAGTTHAHPEYASPEEARGEDGDFRSQFYSLGCTLFELLTGTPPFRASSAEETLRMHAEDAVPDPRDRVSQVNVVIASTILGLLGKDPARRLNKSAELFRRLKKGSQLPKDTAPKDTAPKNVGRPKKINRPERSGVSSSRTTRILAAPTSTREGRRQPARSRVRGAPPRSSAGRGPGSSRQPGTDGDEADSSRKRPRKVHWFTLAGLGLGLGIAVIYSLVQLPKIARDEQEARQKLVEENKALAARTLEERKAEYRQRMAADKAAVARELNAAQKTVTANEMTFDDQKTRLEMAVSHNSSRPGAVAIAELLEKLLASEEKRLTAEQENAYRKIIDEVDKLHAQGRLAAAMERIRAAERQGGGKYEADVDARFRRLEKEIVDRWQKDEKE